MEFKEKIIIVTGSSRSIGKSIALALGARGATIVITYLHKAEEAAKVAEEIKNDGGNAVSLQLDITDFNSFEVFFNKVKDKFGRIDMLVANAFPAAIFSPTAQMSETDYDSMFAATKGHYFLLKTAALKLSEHGKIVVLTSAVTQLKVAGGGAYAGSKSAIEHFVFALAKELGEKKINVNLVSPALIDTDTLVLPQDVIDEYVNVHTPFKRLGLTKEIADTVAFLLSDNARFITGQNIQVSGGMVI